MAQNPLLKDRNYLYYIAAVLLLSALQVVSMYYYDSLELRFALIHALVHWGFLGAICYGLVNSFSFFHPPRFQALIALFLPVLSTYAWYQLSDLIVQMVECTEATMEWMERTGGARANTAYLIQVGVIGFSMLWYRLDERTAQEQRKQETERMAKEAELFKLRQQIQPHFLFNALNSINSLIGSRPKEARQMTQKLSEFLRGTLNREEGELLSLEDELGHLNLYLDLETLRFGHRLQVVREVDDSALQAKVPPLLIQPLLENAIKYGLYGTTDDLEIRMTATMEGRNLKVSLTNPFEDGSSAPGGTGFGIPSIQRRLYLIFGRADLLKTEVKDQVFTAYLTIPQADVQSSNS